jgi:hypothetical protein
MAAGIAHRHPDRSMVRAVRESDAESHADLSMESTLHVATRPTSLVEGDRQGHLGQASSNVSRKISDSATSSHVQHLTRYLTQRGAARRLPRGC